MILEVMPRACDCEVTAGSLRLPAVSPVVTAGCRLATSVARCAPSRARPSAELLFREDLAYDALGDDLADAPRGRRWLRIRTEAPKPNERRPEFGRKRVPNNRWVLAQPVGERLMKVVIRAN